MKILCLHPTQDGAISVEAGADSAILRHGEPVFPDDRPDGWRSLIVPAIRISRLGTSIRRSRARNYYDSFTFFHVLWPASGNTVATGIPAAIADRTFSPGTWLPMPEQPVTARVSVRPLALETSTVTDIVLNPGSLGADAAVEWLSQYMTFKTGDILLFFAHGTEIGPATPDTEITVHTAIDEVLRFRIK